MDGSIKIRSPCKNGALALFEAHADSAHERPNEEGEGRAHKEPRDDIKVQWVEAEAGTL